jgi:hypothetical protein
VNVSQLRHKSGVIAHVVIEIASLPKRFVAGGSLTSLSSLNGDFGFQQLHGLGKRPTVWLAHKHVYVFGHDYIAVYAHLKSAPYLFQR